MQEVQTIIIDEEFRHLMPALDKESYASLEATLLENGCRDAIVLWNGILIDGHNRYEICTKHDIPFNTVSVELPSREDVLIWIINNQVSRRNLTPIQLSHFRGLHYRAERKLVGNRTGNSRHGDKLPQNGEIKETLSTSKRLGEKYKVSKNTIERDAKLSNAIDAIGEASPGAKQMILSDEVRIDKKLLMQLASASKKTIAEVAEHIENGTKVDRDLLDEVLISEYDEPPIEPASETGDSAAAAAIPAAANRRAQLDAAVDILTGTSYRTLLDACGSGKFSAAKKALKAHIGALEKLYSQM